MMQDASGDLLRCIYLVGICVDHYLHRDIRHNKGVAEMDNESPPDKEAAWYLIDKKICRGGFFPDGSLSVSEKDMASEWRRYRLCGIILLFMNQALIGIIVLIAVGMAVYMIIRSTKILKHISKEQGGNA